MIYPPFPWPIPPIIVIVIIIIVIIFFRIAKPKMNKNRRIWLAGGIYLAGLVTGLFAPIIGYPEEPDITVVYIFWIPVIIGGFIGGLVLAAVTEGEAGGDDEEDDDVGDFPVPDPDGDTPA